MRTGKPIADEFAQYIVDAVETDGQLYRQIYRPTVVTLAIKKVKGIYIREKAVKGVMYLVEEGIKKFKRNAEEYYERKFGVIPASVKQKIAVELLAGMEGEIMDAVREMKALKAAGKAWQRKV
jgi:hypothetical protein